ncbi:MAG: hypothetical protein ABJH63_04850 [Rhizobiaceae bacterium]
MTGTDQIEAVADNGYSKIQEILAYEVVGITATCRTVSNIYPYLSDPPQTQTVPGTAGADHPFKSNSDFLKPMGCEISKPTDTSAG